MSHSTTYESDGRSENYTRTQQLRRSDLRGQILDALKRNAIYDLEELVHVCHSSTWNQVFLEVDRLSRTGELRLVPRRAGVYAVTLPVQAA